MEKEGIRKEFFKLRIKGHSYSQCKRLLKSQLDYEVTTRTLQRWSERLNKTEWDLRDNSKRPKTIYHKINSEIEDKLIRLRNKTGFGENKLANYVSLGHTTINRILNKHNLTNPNPNRRKRIKYIRWQRDHPNSLWQMDISDQKIAGKYLFAIIDDCSRYCLALTPLNNISTAIITKCLDELINVRKINCTIYGADSCEQLSDFSEHPKNPTNKPHTLVCGKQEGFFDTNGKPREILTDNGSVFGLRSKHSKFDRWCNKKGIKHIRTAIHSPTTTGKIERLFQTLIKELEFCNQSLEFFRMRYNHFRPHTSLGNCAPSSIYFAFHKLF